MTQAYFDLTHLIERLHRRFLDVLRAELDHLDVDDINAVQSLILANIGDEEITVRDLVKRGYYLGSNASYNIKKLVESGYLEQERSPHDRRSVRIKLSQKGLDLCAKVQQLQEKHAQAATNDPNGARELEGACQALRNLERRWSDYVQFGLSASQTIPRAVGDY
ncbi:MAG: MarR family winged helix-turn-helix transcriptional regulator [Alphaproteobacteria bacterium]